MSELPHQPLVSIDTVPVLVRDGAVHVVLARRAVDPFAGREALPGVLLLANERLAEAAGRALTTKTGAEGTDIRVLRQVGVFDDFDRDPRGPTLSILHLAVLGPDTAVDDELAAVVPIGEPTGLPFDHDTMIAAAAGALLDTGLMTDLPTTRALVGAVFSTADVVRLVTDLAAAAGRDVPYTKNLARDLRALPGVIPAEGSRSAVKGGRGAPARAWTWAD
ncbi:NUDIX domain-containing protein [Tersicoccus sp. MR15.9]|uniref:NUDIX domain-containing protein n=1 Tax=Tersicoccus mangrovi TaxID=3121635 RepID=UPI002FE61599